MQTSISATTLATAWGQEANDILRKCVHCGFCTATCPTYQVLGDELDGPRGRIYLIKQLLEEGDVSRNTQSHLDRCLTCRSCETTCPSGVEYSHLLDIGRHVIEQKVTRPLIQRVLRHTLVQLLTHRHLFNSLVVLGRTLSFILPRGLQRNLGNQKRMYPWPRASHSRKMLLLEGCVQPGLAPNIDLATARVLNNLGIELQRVSRVSCCAAVEWHLSETQKALIRMRANIDAWWPAISAGAEAIVINASACAAMVKEYAYYLRDDAAYAEKAKTVSAMAKDISEVLAREDLAPIKANLQHNAAGAQRPSKLAFHLPCSLQHGQGLPNVVQGILEKLGYTLLPVADAHLCCGAAGTYSLLQKTISQQLLARKLQALSRAAPDLIVTANIGCLLHLQTQAGVEVKHWIELLDP